MKDIQLLIKESKEGTTVIKAITPLSSKSIIVELEGEDLNVRVYND